MTSDQRTPLQQAFVDRPAKDEGVPVTIVLKGRRYEHGRIVVQYKNVPNTWLELAESTVKPNAESYEVEPGPLPDYPLGTLVQILDSSPILKTDYGWMYAKGGLSADEVFTLVCDAWHEGDLRVLYEPPRS